MKNWRSACLLMGAWILAAPAFGQKNVTGEWGAPIPWPHIPVHIAHLADGRIVTFSSTRTTTFPVGDTFTYAGIFDPATNQITDLPNTKHDMFCAGLATTADGRIVVAGGGANVQTTSIMGMDGRWGQNWTQTGNMSQGRWYNTSITLKDGNIFTMWGRGANGIPELFDSPTGLWRSLPGINLSSGSEPNDLVDDDNQWYPHLHLAPNGKVFVAGPLDAIRYLEIVGLGIVTETGVRALDAGRHRKLGSSVQYRPGLILFTGGRDDRYTPAVWNTSLLIDIRNGGVPVITQAPSMNFARAFHQSVMLPNGEVLVVGGNTVGQKFSDDGAVLVPEIWSPTTNQWRLLPPMNEARGYHSTALLMRDGRVLMSGGGLCGCEADHQNSEIYSPGYLFTSTGAAAPRPTVSSVTGELKAGASVALNGSNDITSFSMIRLQATTHGINTDQRYLPVSFTKTGTGQYALTMETNDNVLVPGLYWIFAMNAAGTPSIGYTVQVNATVSQGPGSDNLALGRAATQSSTYQTSNASLAVDGNQDGDYNLGSVTHTQLESQAWWQVDLGAVSNIRQIKVWNRTDGYPERLTNFHVFVSDTPFVSNLVAEVRLQPGVSDYPFPGQPGQVTAFDINRTGRYVRVQLDGTNFLSLAEVEVLAATAGTNRPPVVTLTAPAAGATFDAPASVLISANASDPDGNLAKVEFYNGVAKLGEALTAPYAFTWTNVPEGTYTVSARAIDTAGLNASADATITVRPANRAPTVSLTSPAANADLTAPATVSIAATASDPDNNLTKVEFYNGATKLGEDASAPFVFTWTNVAAGTYTVSAKAIDANGLSATSGVTFTVKPANGAPTVSLTSPTANATYTAPATVSFAATASDPDNNLVKVEFYNGATKLGEDTSAPYNFTWTNVPAGSYTVSAKAIDAIGLNTSASASITVRAPALPPLVIITAPAANASFTAPATIGITATATDADSAIAKVEFFNGAAKIGEDTSSPYSFSWANVATGAYSIEVRATDATGLIGSATVNVTVGTAGVTGLTGEYYNTSAFTDLKFSRTDPTVNFSWGSTGPGGGVNASTYSVRWTGKIEGPYTGTVTLCANANDGMRVTIGSVIAVDNYWNKSSAASSCGTFNSQLGTRYDITIDYYNSGTGATAQLRWWYPGIDFDIVPTRYLTPRGASGNTAPSVTLTSPVANATFTAPASITIAANVSDAENNVARVEFFNGATKLGEDTSAPYSFTWTNVPSGAYTIQARATDAGGLSGNAQVNVTVAGGNTAPSVSLTSPAANATFTAPASITIAANVNDAQNNVARVEFFNGATKLGEDTSAPYSFTWTNVAAGTYTIQARATDTGGLTGSAQVNVTVSGVSNTAPSVTLTSPAANATFTAPASITIAANVSDAQNNVARVEFFNGATKLGEDTSAPYSFTWTNVAAGAYTIQARATDAGGLSGSVQVNVTVTPGGGGSTGLRGEYFETVNFSPSRFVRTDATIDFNWGTGNPGGGIVGNKYSVRWTGKIEAPASENITFCAVSDDGVRVWVKNTIVADGYYDRTSASSCGNITLVKGTKYDIKVDYYNNAGTGASVQLKWWYSSGAFEVVPTRYLTTP